MGYAALRPWKPTGSNPRQRRALLALPEHRTGGAGTPGTWRGCCGFSLVLSPVWCIAKRVCVRVPPPNFAEAPSVCLQQWGRRRAEGHAWPPVPTPGTRAWGLRRRGAAWGHVSCAGRQLIFIALGGWSRPWAVDASRRHASEPWRFAVPGWWFWCWVMAVAGGLPCQRPPPPNLPDAKALGPCVMRNVFSAAIPLSEMAWERAKPTGSTRQSCAGRLGICRVALFTLTFKTSAFHFCLIFAAGTGLSMAGSWDAELPPLPPASYCTRCQMT